MKNFTLFICCVVCATIFGIVFGRYMYVPQHNDDDLILYGKYQVGGECFYGGNVSTTTYSDGSEPRYEHRGHCACNLTRISDGAQIELIDSGVEVVGSSCKQSECTPETVVERNIAECNKRCEYHCWAVLKYNGFWTPDKIENDLQERLYEKELHVTESDGAMQNYLNE